jgi:hypothetical protein
MSARHRARLGSPLRLNGSFELFGKSSKIIRNNIWIFGPLFVLVFLFNFHAWEWTPALGGDTGHHWTRYSWLGAGFASSLPYFLWYAVVGYTIFWFLFVIIAGTTIQIMTQQAQLEATENKSLDSKPYSGYIWGMICVMALIGLFNVIPGIGWMVAFVLGMFYSAAPAIRYQELKDVHGTRNRNAHHQHDAHDDIEEKE